MNEFVETSVINRNRKFWDMTIQNDGFHPRDTLLDGLFSGMYDLVTYDE